MSIVRVIKDKTHPYLIMNKTVLDDKRLSFKSTGLLTYLLGKPDNWFINYYNLVHSKTDGIHSITSSFKELMKFGYIHKHQFRNNDGKYDSYSYLVFEKPEKLSSIKTITQPKSGFPISDKPISDNHTLLINKRKKLIKEAASKSSNKSNSNVNSAAYLESLREKTIVINLLKKMKINSLKKIFDSFPISDIFNYATWINNRNCKMTNPTGFLITALKEKWMDNILLESEDPKSRLYYYRCIECGKVFGYPDHISDYTLCNKCEGSI